MTRLIRNAQNILLLALFFCLNFEIWDPFHTGGRFSVVKMVGLLYFSFVILDGKKFFKITRYSAKLLAPLLLFGLFLTVMNLINRNEVSSTIIDFTYFQWLIFSVLLINHFRMRPALLDWAMFSFAIGSIVLASCYFFDIGVLVKGGRVTIFGDNQNAMAIRMAISFMFLIYNAAKNPLSQTKVTRVLLVPFIFPLIYLLVGAGSRVSLAALVGMLGLSIFLFKVKGFSGKLLYVLVVIAGIWIVADAVMNNEVMLNRLTATAETSDLGGRDEIWQIVLPLFFENPIMGVGQTGYALFAQYELGAIESPHNVIIEILCYTGIIGLVIYSLFWWRLLKSGLLTYRLKNVFFQLLLFMPLTGFVLSGHILHVKLIWCIYTYVIAGAVVARNELTIARQPVRFLRKTDRFL